MLELYKNIRKYRLKREMSQADLAKLTGYTDRSSIAKIEKGDVDLPQSKIMLFADALHVSAGTLMGDTGIDSPTLPPYDNIRPIRKQKLPVLGHIAAGKPILMEEEREVYVETPIKADFILIVQGDSMTGARINNGDIVFVRQQSIVENGEIAVVAIDDEATLKRFYKYGDDLIVLRAENPAYKDMEFRPEDGKEIHVLGKAVAFQSNVK